MEKNFLSSDTLVELEFLTELQTGIHYHENFELLYLLNGRLTVTVEEESFSLQPGDMIVVNANRKHCYEGEDDVLIGRFIISYSKTRELLNQNMILFWCNSVVDKNEAYDELREIMIQIFNQNLKNPEGGRIFLNSLYYQMLHILTSNFLLTARDIRYEDETSRNDDRMQEVFQYIRLNYRQNISLQDIAEQLYLSPTYLSKYIKKKCNISFIDLINSVRLGHAMEDMLYSEASIMKIAMDNGFASVAAFNKVFKEAYDATPSEFRKNAKAKRDSKDQEKKEETRLLIQQKVEAYLEGIPVLKQDDKKKSRIFVEFHAKAKEGRVWKNACTRMMNAGTALDLTKSAFQEQILYIKEKMGIEYVRFWDIYAPELYIDIHAPREQIHFGKLDEVIDFLIKNKLKPYIELGFKPLRLLKTTQNALKEISRDQEFESVSQMKDFFGEMLVHLIKRYGAEEVQTWYFEYWKKEDLVFQELSYSFTPMSEEAQQEYFRRFDVAAGAFREVLPEVRIGGGGFSMQHYGRDGFLYILNSWKKHREKPDFISLNCYPYQIQKEGNLYFEKKSTDLYFVRHNIEKAKELMLETGFPETELHVSEYSLTLSNRNVINDNCSKGAFLMQNAIDCMEEVDMLGYWLATDIYADYQDTQDFLFGGCGLLTKAGVAKPGFYAFEFLNRLYKTMLDKDKNYVLTGNNRGSYRMVCHNFKNLNYNYYLTEENKIRMQDIPMMLEDRDVLAIRVKISGVANGSYVVKQHQVNQKYGSVQDEWKRLNMDTEMNMEEMEYLKRISTPRLSTQRITVDKNVLEFEVKLSANEIEYIHVTYK